MDDLVEVLHCHTRRSVGIGRQGGLKIHCPQGRAGSSPASGTNPGRRIRRPLLLTNINGIGSDVLCCNTQRSPSRQSFAASPHSPTPWLRMTEQNRVTVVLSETRGSRCTATV